MFRTALALATVSGLLLLAGCGSSSSSSSSTAPSATTATTATTATFKQGYKPAVDGFQQTSHAIGLAIEQSPRQSDAQIQTAFQNLAAQWQTHVKALGTLRPPASVAARYATLSSAAKRVEGDLHAVVSAAATHSKTAAERAGASMVKDILAAKAAATLINQKLGVT